MADGILEFTDENWEAEVLKSDKPVVVDFWAAWCGPCRAIAPHVEALANAYNGIAKIGKLDVDANAEVARRYNITSIPRLLFFKGGEVASELVGAVPKTKMEAELRRHLV